jgi:SAM-dependent methyltransferase/ribosomal protein S18 acetylase RimI-like enzyme
MTEVMVRPATEHDLDPIVGLWREMMELHQQIEPLIWTLAPHGDDLFRQHLTDCLANPDYRLFAAQRGPDVVGYLLASKGKRPPVLAPSAQGVMHDTCVTRSARRSGIGRQLVAAAMEWFRSEGLTMATVGYTIANPLSGPFWRAQGFRPYQVGCVRPLVPSTESAQRSESKWYEDFFDEDYMRFHLRGGAREAARTPTDCDFIVAALELKRGDCILDLCCGQGRHSVELAKRGFQVTGADLSEYLLGLARQAADEAGVSVRFHRCDMRDLPWENEFDAVINMFTAFGYFEAEEENEKVLHAARRALRPAGRFLIDLPNRDAFQKMIHDGQRDWYEQEGCLVLEEHTWELQKGRLRLRLRRIIADPNGTRREKGFDLRVYTHSEILEMLASAGLTWQRTFADSSLSDFTPESWRMLVAAAKAEEATR